MGELNISQEKIDSFTAELRSKSEAINPEDLLTKDEATTITANSTARRAYTNFKDVLTVLKENTVQEAENLNHIGDVTYSADAHISRSFWG